jgi:hypothetical protein
VGHGALQGGETSESRQQRLAFLLLAFSRLVVVSIAAAENLTPDRSLAVILGICEKEKIAF